MMIRRSVGFVLAGLLGACGGGNDQATATTPTNASAAPAASSAPATATSATPAPAATTSAAPAASSSSSTAPKLGAEGATCGGIAGIQCATGLKCVMTGPAHPDQAGTCKKP